MTRKAHWEAVFKSKTSIQLSWYQPRLERSLDLMDRSGVGPNSKIIDVGGGDSTLARDLVARGHRAVTVLDVSPTALARARQALGPMASRVTWIEADITEANLPAAEYDLWHDRAVFHFLSLPEERSRYVELLTRSLRSSGHVVIATFGPDGPDHCSGLPAMRYNAEALHAQLGSSYDLLRVEREDHVTPTGVRQNFIYCLFRAAHTNPSA